MSEDRPYTVSRLADRWECSKGAIYDHIRAGRLKAFRLSGKLLRISAGEVERWESGGGNTESANTGSGSSTIKPSSPGETRKGRTAEDWASQLPK